MLPRGNRRIAIFHHNTVLHEKRVDFEIFYILDHNFLLQWFWVLKFDTYTLLYISYLPLQLNSINHKDCDFYCFSKTTDKKNILG